MVHAVNNRCIDVFTTWCGDDDFLCAASDVCRCFFFSREKTCAFQHDVHAQFTPRNIRWITFREYFDLVAIDDHGVAFDYDSKQVYVTNAFDKVLESVKNEKTRLLLLRNQYSQSGLPNVQSLIKDSEAKLARAKEDGAKSLRAYVGNRAQYEQLKAISPSDWPKIVGNEIASDKIEIMQKRHREIIKLVEESRAELGDQIFFPAP